MDKRNRWMNRLCVSVITLAVLLLVLVVDGIAFWGMKYVFHLDFSQDYRKVETVYQLRFWDWRNNKVYIRFPLGLRPLEKRKEIPSAEKPALSRLDTDVYDVAASGDRAAWYDWKESKIFLGSVAGQVQESFDVMYHVENLAFSPDERYLLVYEIEYDFNGGYSTDEEYCYYRVIDLGDGTQYTVYSGYREWLDVYWEEDG